MTMTSLNFSTRVSVFDANVRVGDLRDEPSPCRDRHQLLAEMDRHAVERALIYHAQAESISVIDGNCYLEDWLGDEGRLFPQWLVMPTADSLAQIQALHRQGRVNAVRLYDASLAGLPFRPWVYDGLLSWLSEARIPLWILLPDANIDDIVSTLRAYPNVVSVLVGAHYSHALWVRPVLHALPSAYLELSRYEPIGELEALRDEFGAERLVYGSWYWRYAMGPMLFYLHHTSLHENELALICAGNLERILQGEGNRD
jgi:hypothetical protein